MKITYPFKARNFVLAAALSMALSLAAPAFADTAAWIIGSHGEGFIKLGTLGAVDPSTFPSDINNTGQVVESLPRPTANSMLF
jgi:hypothetical protein